jgi:hypothetical protein
MPMESFKKWLFSEMPANIRHLGNWDSKPVDATPGMTQDERKKASGFKKWGWNYDDFRILTNKNGVEKINRKWLKVPEDVEMYLLRSKTAYKQQEVGMVDETYLINQLGLNVVHSPEEMKQPTDIYINPHALNIIYTNNSSADRVPFTYWTAAHRLGHAIKNDRGYVEFVKVLQKELSNLIQEFYGKNLTFSYGFPDRQSNAVITDFIKHVGTMKSARDGTINRFGEFGYELLAQWMTTGSIKFNPLPRSFGKRGVFGKTGTYTNVTGKHNDDEYEEYNEQLMNLSSTLEYYAGVALMNAVGKIFVM